ncbi:myosin light chain kinase, smooth muscle [Aplochiton taeniatus]
MTSDGSQKRYVSTFRMRIQAPSRPPVEGNGVTTSSNRSRITDPQNGIVSDTGSSCPSPLGGLNPPLFTQPLEDCSVDEGGVILLCGVVTGSPPVRVSWLHNGKLMRVGEPFFNGSSAKLVVRDCLPEDAGAYTCLVENQAGKTSSSAAVCVRDFETICAVRNSKATKLASLSKNVMENGRSKSPLSPKDELRALRGTGSSSSLETQSPTGPHKGLVASIHSFLYLVPTHHILAFTCILIYALSPSTEVIPKRRTSSGTACAVQFENPPQHIEARVGETVRLTCGFSSDCAPVVCCWIRNKQQIVNGSEQWVESSNWSSTLAIAQARPEHAGGYTVVVKDRKSSAQHTLTLSVVERPEPPASCPLVSRHSASCLVLSWSGPCYDGGSAVLGYVVEVRSHGPVESGDWSELTAQCKSTSFRVRSGLRPREEYCFRVRAYNAVGVSKPSLESEAVKMEQEGTAEPQESPPIYEDVVIDSTHKLTDHYNVLEKLGVGKFGQVFKLTHKETGRVCAGKFYKGRRTKEREAARKEIELMNYLHHPKLVQCLGAYDSKPEMVMVLEFIAGGELFERIVDDNYEHTEASSVHYMQQILEGIGYMHQQDIVHLDLKPENIVCVNHTGTFIKIIDFGLASKLDPSVPLKVMHGTPEFVAPEVISYEPVCHASDMWSIGVISFILLSGESPFQGNSDAESLALVTAAQYEFDEDSFEDITDQAKDFISSLLNKDTRRRMSCEEALAHPWMAAFVSADPSTTKSLSKEKMKRFLAKQKWKKAGKALLALKRMALLSKGDGTGSSGSPTGKTGLNPDPSLSN